MCYILSVIRFWLGQIGKKKRDYLQFEHSRIIRYSKSIDKTDIFRRKYNDHSTSLTISFPMTKIFYYDCGIYCSQAAR
jgi:hypothetical protein